MERRFYRGFPGRANEGLAKYLLFLYKEYIVSIVLIVGGVIIILLFLTAQIQVWFALQKEARELRAANSILKNNLQFISRLSELQIDQQVQTVGAALPTDKEFVSVLNSISAASLKSGILLGDYDFQVGELASKSAQIGLKRPSINISLQFRGGVDSFNGFLNELYRQLPLVEATETSFTSALSVATFDFYYKPFLPIQVNYEKPVLQMSGKDQTVLNTISGWNNESVPIDTGSLL